MDKDMLMRGFGILGIAGVLVGLLVATNMGSLAPKACRNCNVILISLDTLGAKHTSLYNSALETTPFLKKLADERGVVFTNAYAQAPWTLPSHAAMLTGKYPWDIGVWIPGDQLPLKEKTLAEALYEHGYDTALFSIGAFVQPRWQFDQGFEETYGEIGDERAWNDLPNLSREALSWIEKHTAGDRPFFLMLRPFEVHDPYGDPDAGGVGITELVRANQRPGGPTVAETERFRDAYHTEIREMDDALQEFFDTLKRKGLLEKSIVVITADHGEEFNEHGTAGFHSVTLYREVLHVPLIVLSPTLSATHVNVSVEVRSIPATVAELLGVPENAFEGVSLVSLAKGTETTDHTVRARTALERSGLLENIQNAYATIHTLPVSERTEPFPGPITRAVIRGSWHLIENPSGSKELFSLDEDPDEQVNWYGNPAVINVRTELEQEL